MKWYCILSNAFCLSSELLTWFNLQFAHLVYHIYWSVYVEPSCTLRINPTWFSSIIFLMYFWNPVKGLSCSSWCLYDPGNPPEILHVSPCKVAHTNAWMCVHWLLFLLCCLILLLWKFINFALLILESKKMQ